MQEKLKSGVEQQFVAIGATGIATAVVIALAVFVAGHVLRFASIAKPLLTMGSVLTMVLGLGLSGTAHRLQLAELTLVQASRHSDCMWPRHYSTYRRFRGAPTGSSSSVRLLPAVAALLLGSGGHRAGILIVCVSAVGIRCVHTQPALSTVRTCLRQSCCAAAGQCAGTLPPGLSVASSGPSWESLCCWWDCLWSLSCRCDAALLSSVPGTLWQDHMGRTGNCPQHILPTNDDSMCPCVHQHAVQVQSLDSYVDSNFDGGGHIRTAMGRVTPSAMPIAHELFTPLS